MAIPMILSGRPGWASTSKGTYYPVAYLIKDSERSVYQLSYGSDMSSLLQADYPGVTATVERVTMRSAGRNKAGEKLWVVVYEGSSDTSLSLFPKDINKSIKLYDFQFTPKMLGLRTATDADRKRLLISYQTEVACNPGELIALNATSSSKGSLSYGGAPFTAETMATAFATMLAGNILYLLANPVKAVSYEVVYPKYTNDIDVEEWVGVSGSWGSYGPKDKTTAAWLAIDQTSITGRRAGAIFHQTIRLAHKAPKIFETQLIWDSTKNGGTWTW